ncbi:hypothetical protein AMTR_s00888p00003850 [Amborella trichopoda]|uniref:Uncharacterized protein n=1 Tax=Amborella trichopoda TaxID=13333 RepID=W1NSE2_AMBTC|nr:hypothetical protein AMTR_s00888p00003850 [Amborella trichopoda]
MEERGRKRDAEKENHFSCSHREGKRDPLLLFPWRDRPTSLVSIEREKIESRGLPAGGAREYWGTGKEGSGLFGLTRQMPDLARKGCPFLARARSLQLFQSSGPDRTISSPICGRAGLVSMRS